jgi:hydrogenase maturation protein HypF
MDRRAITVTGIVQGVGFRPFVHELANRHGLRGFVRNQTGGLLIEVEGEWRSLDRFYAELTERPPRLARIDEVCWTSRSPAGDQCFRIEPSTIESVRQIFISPDVATCDDCLRELFDPHDRRYQYPFINCTNCGPRLTIVRAAPYDRERTTMAPFAMCAKCQAEYDDPRDRRFHAQPVACPACGPRLRAWSVSDPALPVQDPLSYAIASLERGEIVAVKGLGGYHLACLAERRGAVSELRARKHRDEKPFALMVRDVLLARELCEVDDDEAALLTSSRRPIVLLRRRPGFWVAPEVAPQNPNLGVMLPYTPLHHLLVNGLDGAPLVMTSGNTSDEPIAHDDDDAAHRLSEIAGVFLGHDRPIHVRCDDSVTRLVAGFELPLRRSRGFAPEPLELPVSLRQPSLALGGELKVVFALGRGRHAFLSHHIGDLEHYEAYRSYELAIEHYKQLFALEPELIVHDAHPDYESTRFAWRQDPSIPRHAVFHHHAHLASCMADNGLDEPVIGVTFDGAGYGSDGAIWGGEFLTGDYRAFQRAAHLRYVCMAGGEQAVREPWRMAAAYLADAELTDSLLRDRIPAPALATARRQIDRRLNAPLTSSVGRLFDAVSALAGIRTRASFEGQPAMELEWLAREAAADGTYPFEILESGTADAPLQVDLRPLIVAVAADAGRGCPPAKIARVFHSTLVEIVAQVCARLRVRTGLNVVVLSGGVFQNSLLTTELIPQLVQDGFRVYRHRRVPPGDGGLSLGQLAIAAVLNDTASRAGAQQPRNG